MARYWATVLFAVVLAGLAAYVYWVELPAERSKAREEARAARLVTFSREDVTALSLASRTADVSLVRGEDGRWTITAPVRADADQSAVRALLRALELGTVERVIDAEPADLEPFGLEQPSVVVTVRAGAQEERILLGDSGPITSTLYAMRGSAGRVLLTSLAPKDFLNTTLRSLRRKQVLVFDRGKIERLRLTDPPTEYVLYRRGRGAHAGMDRWEIRYPIEAPADDTEVAKLLLKLDALEAVDFIDPGPEYDALAARLGAPRLKITLYAGGKGRGLALYEPPADGGQVYARTTDPGPIYRVNPFVVPELSKDLFALRDKRLLGIEPEDVAILEVRTRTERYVLLNQSGDWMLEDQPRVPLKRDVVQLFVNRVTTLPAEIQVLKRAGALAPYGLASPAADFRVTSTRGRASRLILGKKEGGLVYTKGGGLPGIYQARSLILDQIPAKRELLATEPASGSTP